MKKTSKFIMLSFLWLLTHLVSTPIKAQNTSLQNSDFSTINQKWSGQLQYLNYGDDKSIVKIPCTLTTDFNKGKIRSLIVFDEKDGNGKKMTSKSKFHLSKNGKYFMIDKENGKLLLPKIPNRLLKLLRPKKEKIIIVLPI